MAWGTASCPKVFEVHKLLGYMFKISSDLFIVSPISNYLLLVNNSNRT
jgi:hypothetical protein